MCFDALAVISLTAHLCIGAAPGDEGEKAAIAAIKELKGVFHREDHNRDRPIVWVDLSYTKATNSDLRDIAKLHRLKTLFLTGSIGITDAGLKSLSHVQSIESLMLGSMRLTDAGLKNLGRLEHLQRLELSCKSITDSGLEALAGLEDIRGLYFKSAQITDVGAAELAKHKKLQWLDLTQTRVTNAGLQNFATLDKLVLLRLNDTSVTEDGVNKLKLAIPNCSIYCGPSPSEPRFRPRQLPPLLRLESIYIPGQWGLGQKLRINQE